VPGEADDLDRPAAWDWERVLESMVASWARTAGDERNAVEVRSVTRLADPWDVTVSFVDRRDGSRHQQSFDLVSCSAAYDATSVKQLAAMVYSDLEESVLSGPTA